MLLKPAGAVPHVGGVADRSRASRTTSWSAPGSPQGVKLDLDSAARDVSIEVLPEEPDRAAARR